MTQVLSDYPEELRGDVCLHLHKEVLGLPLFQTAPQGCLKSLALAIKEQSFHIAASRHRRPMTEEHIQSSI